MTPFQAVLYIVAVILIVVAALGVPVAGRVSLALLGAAVALLAYTWPGLVALA